MSVGAAAGHCGAVRGQRLVAQAGEDLDVGVGLVGQDGLEAMAVVVAAGQLRAGMRALTPDDDP